MTPNILIVVPSSMHNNLYNVIIINLLIKFRFFNTAVTDMPNIKPVNLISYTLLKQSAFVVHCLALNNVLFFYKRLDATVRHPQCRQLIITNIPLQANHLTVCYLLRKT